MKKFHLIFLLLAATVLQGCASRQMWYKPGGTQREFDLDSKECEIIAKQQARAMTETGKRYYPADYAQRYLRCIAAQGWSTTPLTGRGKKQESARNFSLGTLTGHTITAFGRQIVLPPAATLMSSKKQAIGPTRLESFLFRDATFFVNVILQDSDTASFQKIPYPVNDPYQLYTSNHINDLQWAAFWEQTGKDWVEGIGAFLRFSRHQRAVIVITAPLAPPAAAPPAKNLHLAANQQQSMQKFLEQWRPWLQKQSRPASLAWRTLRTTLGLFKTF